MIRYVSRVLFTLFCGGLLAGCVEAHYSAAPADWVAYEGGTADRYAFDHPIGWRPVALAAEDGPPSFLITPTHPENVTVGTFKPDRVKETECWFSLTPLADFGSPEEAMRRTNAAFAARIAETSLLAGEAEDQLADTAPAGTAPTNIDPADPPLLAKSWIRHFVIGQRRRTTPVGTTTSGVGLAWLSTLQVWISEETVAELTCSGPRHWGEQFDALGLALRRTFRSQNG